MKLQSTKILNVVGCKYLESNIKATAFSQEKFENRGVEWIKNSFTGNLGQKDRNGIQHGSKIKRYVCYVNGCTNKINRGGVHKNGK